MSDLSTALVEAAERLVGAPFRLHGRDPATGLDCVGLVAEALRRCGRVPLVPGGYRMHALSAGPLLKFAAANGFEPTEGPERAGDVVLVHIAGLQPHLLLAGRAGEFLHAHAGLGRVVRQPGPCPWAIVARWRLAKES
jgi:cell wall-associated NlpC family hydrolase